MLLANLNEWYIELSRFINYELSELAFLSILALLLISILLIVRFMVKNGYNQATPKKNLFFPFVLLIILCALTVFLAVTRYV